MAEGGILREASVPLLDAEREGVVANGEAVNCFPAALPRKWFDFSVCSKKSIFTKKNNDKWNNECPLKRSK